MTQALMPEVFRDFTARWGVRPDEIAGLLGTTPAAVAEAIATEREPTGANFQGAVLAGAVYCVLADRAKLHGLRCCGCGLARRASRAGWQAARGAHVQRPHR